MEKAVVGFAAIVLAITCLVAPNDVVKFLQSMMEDDKKAQAPSYTPQATTSTTPNTPFEWGEWSATIVFGGISVVILVWVRWNMEEGAMRCLLSFCAFLPLVFGLSSSYLFQQEAWKDSAQWLERAGIIAVAIIALAAIGFYANNKLGETKVNVDKIIKSTN